MPSVPRETSNERMFRIRREQEKAAARQEKEAQQAFLNAEAKKAKRAAKVAREAQIPCKACGKVQADCFCSGWHKSSTPSSAKQRADKRQEREQEREQQRAERQRYQGLTPEQRERLKHLRVLGLSLAQDTQEEIKKAYRSLALVNHPDKKGDPEIMKAINCANDFLKD